MSLRDTVLPVKVEPVDRKLYCWVLLLRVDLAIRVSNKNSSFNGFVTVDLKVYLSVDCFVEQQTFFFLGLRLCLPALVFDPLFNRIVSASTALFSG